MTNVLFRGPDEECNREHESLFPPPSNMLWVLVGQVLSMWLSLRTYTDDLRAWQEHFLRATYIIIWLNVKIYPSSLIYPYLTVNIVLFPSFFSLWTEAFPKWKWQLERYQRFKPEFELKKVLSHQCNKRHINPWPAEPGLALPLATV